MSSNLYSRFRLTSLALVALATFSCQREDSDALPPDPALLGRWEQAPFARQTPPANQPRRSLEFTAGGTVRFFRNDTLIEEHSYELRRPTKNLEVTPNDRFLSWQSPGIQRVYRIQADTLRWHSPYYKNVMNCFPLHEQYVRAGSASPR
jgi:hypothetical protein